MSMFMRDWEIKYDNLTQTRYYFCQIYLNSKVKAILYTPIILSTVVDLHFTWSELLVYLRQFCLSFCADYAYVNHRWVINYNMSINNCYPCSPWGGGSTNSILTSRIKRVGTLLDYILINRGVKIHLQHSKAH